MGESVSSLVQLDTVSRIYAMGQTDVTALSAVSLSICAGEYIAITGTSGSGKSTLLQIIGCLDTPTTGRYVLNGTRVDELSDFDLSHVRNHQIGFVFQAFHLLPQFNVCENIELPLLYRKLTSQQREKKVKEALGKVGLNKRGLHKPHELSGGERQRVAIARALVGSPSLLLADEPTGNLDHKTGEEIMHIIERLNAEGVTVVMVTHDLEKAQRARRRIEMQDGRIL
ncbi:ABC transporter ATP-binding protein [Photobacterium sp. DNB23_23_1]|uniref:ABC transporter ATP-binding protein n=1 Tax=Photobacterium pectinilyticum TaxID=2906793 RepID=A0ABT1N456_9GAMM|nr:ABC transporter ATP-binding protein [Photobacterium sp. ZSDE20]MCQ1058029.1 ABC transporter ATP-binding protein [Photobacterium sp. ZSDE20]MDD1822562.1 ABC transporter ATP-binding protein [Photobacterium sp. ZSDE20]